MNDKILNKLNNKQKFNLARRCDFTLRQEQKKSNPEDAQKIKLHTCSIPYLQIMADEIETLTPEEFSKEYNVKILDMIKEVIFVVADLNDFNNLLKDY